MSEHASVWGSTETPRIICLVTPYLIIALITFLAGFTQGLSGFGSILLALPLLTIMLDIKTVVPLAALDAFLATIILLFELRRHLDWKKILPLVAGSLPGIPIGVFFLKYMNTDAIQLTMGIMLLVYAFFGLLFRPVVWEMKAAGASLAGFGAGCLGGALGASGPPVIVYTSLQPWTKDVIKATLQGFLAASGMVVILLHALSGLTTMPVLRYFLVSMPALVVGTILGSFFYGRIDEKAYRRIILIVLALLGGFLVYEVL